MHDAGAYSGHGTTCSRMPVKPIPISLTLSAAAESTNRLHHMTEVQVSMPQSLLVLEFAATPKILWRYADSDPSNSPARMDTPKWPNMPEQERKRKLFVISYLETTDDKAAAKASGITSHHARQGIAEHLKEYGTLAEAPHPKASPKFTYEVMKAAQTYLVDNPEMLLTTGDVVAYLERENLLQPPTDEHNFLAHFTPWLAAKGLTLQVGTTQMIFEITPQRARERLLWVKQHRAQLGKEFGVDDIIIVDETTFEEGPHPKGDASPQALFCTQMHVDVGTIRITRTTCNQSMVHAILFGVGMNSLSCIAH